MICYFFDTDARRFVANNENDRPDEIGAMMRQAFRQIAEEPVPEELLKLLYKGD